MSKPVKKHHVPVDGKAINKGWTIENARYVRRFARHKLAAEQKARVDKQIAENHDGKTTHVPAEF